MMNLPLLRRIVAVVIVVLSLNANPFDSLPITQAIRIEEQPDPAFVSMNSFEEVVAIKSKELGYFQERCAWGTNETKVECDARGEYIDYWYRPNLKKISIPIEYYEVLNADNTRKCKREWRSGLNGHTPQLISGTAQVYQASRGAGKGSILLDSEWLDLATSVAVRFNGGRPVKSRVPRSFQKSAMPVPRFDLHPCNGSNYTEKKTDKDLAENYHLYPVPKKVGKYDVTFYYKNPSRWKCSVYFPDVCKWFSYGDELIARVKFKVTRTNVVITYHKNPLSDVLNDVLKGRD
jgi:hypothetical protein